MAETYEDIRVERAEGHVGVIVIDRPKKRNALRQQTFEELARGYEELHADDDVRAILIHGAGDKAFSAGADLSSAFSGGGGSLGEAIGAFHRFLDRMESGGKLVVGALNGDTLAGGLELAMACHIRICDPAAHLGLTETNVGIFPAGGGTVRLPRLVGYGRAIQMIVFGERIDAREALEFGLVQLLATAPGYAVPQGLELAQFAATRPTKAVAAALECILAGQRFGVSAALDAEREKIVEVVATEDALEGMQAFLGKRDAVFKGK